MRLMSGATVENILKSSRSLIIDLLKGNGSMSVEQLAESMGVSKVCVRRHLSLLEQDGLIGYEKQRHERGRPRYIYRLTTKARCLFPQNYDVLAREILVEVERQYGSDGLERVLAGRANELIAQMRDELVGLGFDDRVKALARVLTSRGYVADSRRQRDGSYRLRHRHCPTESLAIAYPGICDEEVRIYREALGGEVMRECRIVDGHRDCEFRILGPALTQIVRR